MARTIAQIEKQMIDEAKNQTLLKLIFYDTNNVLRPVSQTNIFQQLVYIVALGISIFEQLMDVFKSEIEEIVSNAAPATAPWIRDKVLRFQYDASVPQVVTLVDFIPGYAVVDETKRIITRCSVKTDVNNTVKVKVAKSDPPVVLAAAEETALDAYLAEVLPAGIQRSIVNLTADKLWVDATIYFNGQYAATIQADVIAALDAFLANLSSLENFGGVVKVSAIEDEIQKVPGVTDVVIDQVKARPDSIPYSGASTIARYWETVSGYIVQENTSGQTFSDTLTFVVANN